MPTAAHESSGCRPVTSQGQILALEDVMLSAEARGGLARVTLRQTFRNGYAEPLAVTYQLPLPSDAAVSGFAFTIGDRKVIGEIDRRDAARARFDEAMLQGRTAALVEQTRSSLFTQELGNIPPGTDVVCEIVLDQRLRWLEEGAWEWRFPTVVGPRYLGAPGRVPDADSVTVDVADAALPARCGLSLAVRDAVVAGRRPDSPSHPVQIQAALGGFDVALPERARLDRDVVVRWPVAELEVGLSVQTALRGDALYGLLTLVPPRSGAGAMSVPRDLVVLLDTSGSMSGEPLDQARRVCSALVDSLEPQDQLELIEFGNSPRRWHHGAVQATPRAKSEALAWLARLRASGGTEMRTAIVEALQPLRAESQRQVVLVTDGLIGFEQELIGEVLERLPRGSRVHTVGVGSSVNRSLTGPLARAGRGAEIIVSLGEDPERAARSLRERTASPAVVDLALQGPALLEVAPRRLPDLFAGSPVLVGLRIDPRGGEVTVTGRTHTGSWQAKVQVAASPGAAPHPAVPALFAREVVEDLETARAVADTAAAAELDRRIESIALTHQIASRMTSWVAATETATVDPRAPTRRERIPQELPQGLDAGGLGIARRSMTMGKSRAMSSVPRGAATVTLGRPLRVQQETRGTPKPPPAPVDTLGEDEASRAPQLTGATGSATPPRHGRVLHWKDGELVIEVESDGGAFDPAAMTAVRVELEDGQVLEARVDVARSTLAGRPAAGLWLRLTLQVDAPAPASVRSVTLSQGFITWTVLM
jgi:Ca-activated chloride channel homolog